MFVNEMISKTDFENYELAKIDEKYIYGGSNSRSWTIDKDRNIYLRQVSSGREEFNKLSTWVLFWEDDLIEVSLKLENYIKPASGIPKIHWKVIGLKIPHKLELHKSEMLKVLLEALEEYKDGGVYSTSNMVDVVVDLGEVQ